MPRIHRGRVPRIKSSAELPEKRAYRFKVLCGNLAGVGPGGIVEMFTTAEHAQRLVKSGRAKILPKPQSSPTDRPNKAVDEKE